MSLFCSICKNEVPDGFNQCLSCKAGFAPQLACRACQRLVPRGAATCAACERAMVVVAAPESIPATSPVASSTKLAIVSPSYAPPVLPGLPSHVGLTRIAETYSAGQFGVTATVQTPALDVEIMNEMGQVVVILHTLASKMNKFQGIMESTRSVIRQCRTLATELQDEIESRRGPQG